MQNKDLKSQALDIEQLEQSKELTTANLVEKELSQFVILMFIAIAFILYGYGVYQLNNTVNNIVETVVEKVNRNYGVKGF